MGRIPIVAYDRQHEDAFMRFSEKVLGAEAAVRRQRVIEMFHDRMPGRSRVPLRYVCMDGDVVAGTLGYMPADFLVKGDPLQARYTHDLLVDPAYTGHMLGKRMILETLNRGDFFPGGMWMTHTCYKLHLFCGFEEAPSLTTFTSVLKPREFLEQRQFSFARRAALRVALEVTRRVSLMKAERVLAAASTSLDSPKRFDAVHDRAWLDLARSHALTRARDAEYLNWKYMDHPLLDYRIVTAKSNGEPRGFMVWRLAPEGLPEQRAVVADFLVERNDRRTLEEMTARVLMDASAYGAHSVALLVTQSWAQKTIRSLGFMPARTRNTWVVGGWPGAVPREWLKDSEQWHMCMGDSDGDIWTGSM